MPNWAFRPLSNSGMSVQTMGRSLDEERPFFLAAAATGLLASQFAEAKIQGLVRSTARARLRNNSLTGSPGIRQSTASSQPRKLKSPWWRPGNKPDVVLRRYFTSATELSRRSTAAGSRRAASRLYSPRS